MSRKPFDDRNNANRLLSLKVMMEGSHHQSQLTLEVDQIDHLFPFGTAGKFKLVFLQNMTTNWRPAQKVFISKLAYPRQWVLSIFCMKRTEGCE